MTKSFTNYEYFKPSKIALEAVLLKNKNVLQFLKFILASFHNETPTADMQLLLISFLAFGTVNLHMSRIPVRPTVANLQNHFNNSLKKKACKCLFFSQDYIYIGNGSYCLSSQCYWIEVF